MGRSHRGTTQFAKAGSQSFIGYQPSDSSSAAPEWKFFSFVRTLTGRPVSGYILEKHSLSLRCSYYSAGYSFCKVQQSR